VDIFTGISTTGKSTDELLKLVYDVFPYLRKFPVSMIKILVNRAIWAVQYERDKDTDEVIMKENGQKLIHYYYICNISDIVITSRTVRIKRTILFKDIIFKHYNGRLPIVRMKELNANGLFVFALHVNSITKQIESVKLYAFPNAAIANNTIFTDENYCHVFDRNEVSSNVIGLHYVQNFGMYSSKPYLLPHSDSRKEFFQNLTHFHQVCSNVHFAIDSSIEDGVLQHLKDVLHDKLHIVNLSSCNTCFICGRSLIMHAPTCILKNFHPSVVIAMMNQVIVTDNNKFVKHCGQPIDPHVLSEINLIDYIDTKQLSSMIL